MRARWLILMVAGMVASGTGGWAGADGRDGFVVIAHRGASGYVPEHTAVASAMAHGMRADFIEQDVVFSRDGVPVVIHDVRLETTTDVARRFPEKQREDGHFYVIDFTAAELRQLRKGERRNPVTGEAVFPERYPAGQFRFPLLFLEEAVALIRGMDASSGRRTGLYPELKRPEFHLENGMDPVPLFMEALERSGALAGPAPCLIQCFHAATLRRIRREYGEERILVQLIGENDWQESSDDYAAMRTPEGLAAVAEYADGIGLPLERLVTVRDGRLQWLPIKATAHQLGLRVHPYTARRETLPAGIGLQELMDFLAGPEGVEGVFTDFPDVRPSR